MLLFGSSLYTVYGTSTQKVAKASKNTLEEFKQLFNSSLKKN